MTTEKIRAVLNALFLVGALAAVITYFTIDDFQLFIYICGAAIFVKVVEIIIRMTN